MLESKNIRLVIAVVLIVGAILIIGIPTPSPSFTAEDANICSALGNCPQAPADFMKKDYKRAPELTGLTGVINTDSNISLANLKGKVVLIDFWTYTCINCIRTLPYLNAWHEKYADKGLVIIGVHSPEFEFEKDYSNVKNAVQKYGVKYPVVQDNDFATWRAYENHYWPHKFLVDADGYIRYDHIGEGGYEETEGKIVKLLGEKDANLKLTADQAMKIQTETDFTKIGTPEIYLGYNFARSPLGNNEGFIPEQTILYSLPSSFIPNLAYFEGEWKNNGDNVELVSETGKVALVFTAKNVNIVAGNDLMASALLPQLDGSPITGSSAGSDATMSSVQGGVAVREQRLYNIVSLPDYAQNKELVFTVRGKGLRLYTFTFG